jgi:arylsulfatase A-like enzyme
VTDLLPTVAEIAGVEVPANIDGVSFLPVLADPDAGARDLAYTELFWDDASYTWAIRDPRWKLLVSEDWGYNPYGHETGAELYDLEADPDELVDLVGAPEGADALARLTEAGDALRARLRGER